MTFSARFQTARTQKNETRLLILKEGK